jgi:hypothetical protein
LAPATTTIPVAEQMLIPDEDTQAEKTPEIPPAELEQKVAPPIESSSGN